MDSRRGESYQPSEIPQTANLAPDPFLSASERDSLDNQKGS